MLENARKKLVSKALDAIVVNDVSREGVGFDSDRNAVTIITHSEVIEVPETTKWEVAQRVLDQAVAPAKGATGQVAHAGFQIVDFRFKIGHQPLVTRKFNLKSSI